MEYDLHHNVNGLNALNLQTIATDTTTAGVIIDTKGYESIEFFIKSGTITDGTYTVKLEDGDDSGLSDAADIVSDLVLGTLPDFVAADDNAIRRVGTITKKRYVRLSIVSTGTTSGGEFDAIAVQSNAYHMPVADQST